MKPNTRIFLIAMIAICLYACNNGAEPVGNVETSKQATVHGDAKFLISAYDMGLYEIEAAKLADKNAQDPKVKAFAARMQSEYTDINNTISSLAKSESVDLPSEMSHTMKDKYNRINNLSGKDFDQDYAGIDADRYDDYAASFDKVATSDCSQALRDLASASSAKIKEHSDAVKKLKGDLK